MVLKLMCPDIWQYQVLGLEVTAGAALFSEQVHAFECRVILFVFLYFCSQECHAGYHTLYLCCLRRQSGLYTQCIEYAQSR